VTATEGLPAALRSAWGLNRHSVVEVVTSRTSNLDRHREIQAAAAAAAGAALRLLQPAAAVPAPGAATLPLHVQPYSLAVQSASWHAYRLPLARPLTTGQGGEQRRCGLLLRVSLQGADGRLVHGVGEVAPLPGLHAESLPQAEQQVELLCQLLSSSASSGSGASSGVSVPLKVALLGGRLGSWLRRGLGVEPARLLPSVRCGLEAALLSALAQHRGASLAHLLAGCPPADAAAQLPQAAAVNGLLDCQGSPEEAAAEAAALLAHHPLSALKIKVGRRADPLEDAAAVLAIRAAVGPSVALRADANRRWGLEAAAAFAAAAAPAGLQYVEEPLARTADLAELYRRTGVQLALDESVDEGEGRGGREAAVPPPCCSHLSTMAGA
jgi:isochorismate synthase/2-succinyl-5-enolpyruvyl-6-hydroxy-3-cyclohexene-1-carboxylate synthase/2-succinyl-6-hydroxy-2,4-cyclohexadiene-1-carboxylate synthase/O-succinylbenzoate synthase